MADIPGRHSVAFIVVLAILGFAYFAPYPVLQELGWIWNLFLLAATAATLFWFAYWICLRRLLRARRITRLRELRLLAEAAARDLEPSEKSGS